MNYTTTWTLNVSDKVSSPLSIINEKGRKTAELVGRIGEMMKSARSELKKAQSRPFQKWMTRITHLEKSMRLFKGSYTATQRKLKMQMSGSRADYLMKLDKTLMYASTKQAITEIMNEMFSKQNSEYQIQ